MYARLVSAICGFQAQPKPWSTCNVYCLLDFDLLSLPIRSLISATSPRVAFVTRQSRRLFLLVIFLHIYALLSIYLPPKPGGPPRPGKPGGPPNPGGPPKPGGPPAGGKPAVKS